VVRVEVLGGARSRTVKIRIVTWALGTLITAVATVAAAQPVAAPGEVPDSVEPLPRFATIDRADGTSRLGIDAAVTLYEDSFNPVTGDELSLTALRLELHGSMFAASGWGGYGAMPFSMLFADGAMDLGIDDQEAAIGNVELGGARVLALAASRVVVRAGVVLPTADDSFGGTISNAASIYPRLTDGALVVPDATWGRVAASWLGRSGQILYQVDGGIDVPFEGGPDAPLARVNGGLGLDFGGVAALAELVTLIATEDEEDDDEERMVHTLGLTARYVGGVVHPSVSVVVPVASGPNAVDLAIVLAVQMEMGTR
jgi:hypothetical protein